ncbi:MAG: MauE/DoxX family redox-associated membrane protein [Microthrixaceae bacterium]
MDVLAAGYWVVALVLVVSGVGKLVDGGRTRRAMAELSLPAPTFVGRLVGLWEVLIGGSALLAAPGGVAGIVAVLVALTYLVLAVVVVFAIRRGLEDCGCVGMRATRPSWTHVVMNLVSVAIALAAAVWGPLDLVGGLEDIGMPLGVGVGAAVAVVAGAVVALPGAGASPNGTAAKS